MKFVNKKNLKEYVSPENMLRCWGGLDDYQFQWVPQNPNIKILPRDDMEDGNNNIEANRNSNGLKKVIIS